MDDDKTDNDDLSIAESEQDLSNEILEKRQKGLLKTGFTTGTCASAATKSALLSLLTNVSQSSVQVTLPKGKIITLNILWTRIEKKICNMCSG